MGRWLLFATTASAVAFAFVPAPGAPAAAQCRLCATPTPLREEGTDGDEISLHIETGLDFDRLVLSGEGSGSAILSPDGSTTIGGSVAEVSPRAMVGRAIVRGQPGRPVRVELPARIVLRSLAGGEIEFNDVRSDLPAIPKLDGAGTLTFRFGGRLTVRGDADGEFRGEMPITVEYL